MINGIDCVTHITAKTAPLIKSAGYDFVARYLVPATMGKHLSAAEAKIISDAGLKILSVYESTADRVKGGAAAGKSDGASACALARTIGMPTGGYIYFAVDYDAQAGDYGTIEAYLRAARAQTGDYEVGVYGSYRVVEAMYARGACRGFWQCFAWSYGKVSAYRTVYQYKNAQTVAGINVDLNEAADDTGLWDYNDMEDSMTIKNTTAKIGGAEIGAINVDGTIYVPFRAASEAISDMVLDKVKAVAAELDKSIEVAWNGKQASVTA